MCQPLPLLFVKRLFVLSFYVNLIQLQPSPLGPLGSFPVGLDHLSQLQPPGRTWGDASDAFSSGAMTVGDFWPCPPHLAPPLFPLPTHRRGRCSATPSPTSTRTAVSTCGSMRGLCRGGANARQRGYWRNRAVEDGCGRFKGGGGGGRSNGHGWGGGGGVGA